MKQKLLKKVLMLTLLTTGATAAWADIAAPQSEENGKVMYLVGRKNTGFDIKVNYNGQWIQTTYSNYGYHTVISFDGRTRQGIGFTDPKYGFDGDTGDFAFGKTYTVNDIEVTIVASIPAANAGAVTIKYHAKNVGSQTKSFNLGTYADTQVGSNDKCDVYREGDDTVVMEDNSSSSSSFGGIYKLKAITPFTTRWLGKWSKTDMPTKAFVNSFDYNSGEDSAIAWSWDITLAPGEEVEKIIGSGDVDVKIFDYTDEIDLNVPANLGKDANGVVDGSPTDLYEFLQFYLNMSSNPPYIKLRLEPDAYYVISKPLEIMTAITIEGMDAKYPAIIDASALDGPFVQTPSDQAPVLSNIRGYYTTVYGVTFRNFMVKGLKHQFFYANNKPYLIPYFTVDNCNIRMTGANSKSFFDFSGNGYVEELLINKSTLSADDATTWSDGGLFSSKGGITKADCNALGFKLTLTNNTLYNVSKGMLECALCENSQNYMSYTVCNNVIINSGKKGEFIKGLNAGVNSNIPKWLVQLNSFLWTTDNVNYEDTNAKEVDGASSISIWTNVDCDDTIGTDVNGHPILGITLDNLFNNGNEGLSEGNFSLNDCPQKTAKIGDPRWLQPSKLEKYITYAELDDDKDLAKEINKYAKDGYTVFNLEENAYYAVKQPIVADRSLLIKGKNVRIDASKNDGEAFILLSKTPGVGLTNNYYRMGEITLKGLTITGLKGSLLYDNGVQYCVPTMTIDDCVIGLATETVQNEAIISFKQGGVKDFTIKNSTVYGNNAVAKYFIRYNNSARLDRYGYDKDTEFQTMTYTDNTFYGLLVADGQWGNYNGISGQVYSKFDVERNIWYNCGKDIIRRMAGGRFNGSNPMTFDKNTYFNGDVSTAESEAGYDKSGTILTSNPGFLKPANGDFTLSAYSDQAIERTGDPRWYVNGVHYYTGIETINNDNTAKKGIYDLQGRRVTDTSKKGVYIINGKKILK